MSRRDGEDPASFATELEILAVRVSERSASRSGIGSSWDNETGLRRHLDSVPPDTPIREIVDRCRVWESHSDIYRLSPAPALGPEAVIQDATDNSSCGRRERDPGLSDRPTNCMDSREFLSKLMAGLRQSVHQGTPAELGRDTLLN